jgi:hypothetical protein
MTPKMKIEPATTEAIMSVAAAMRERDFQEFCAAAHYTHRSAIGRAADERRRDLICASRDEPIAVGGVILTRPNVGSLIFFATDQFPEIATGLTRWITRELFPRCRAAGVHRIDCVSIDGYEQTHRWIELLGLKREGVLRKFGRGGEDFHQFAWVQE